MCATYRKLCCNAYGKSKKSQWNRRNDQRRAEGKLNRTGQVATADEPAFEQTDASTGLAYQDAVAQAAHDYRQAVALADHDLTESGNQAAYDAALAAEVSAFTQAYQNFAAFEGSAMTLAATNDANAVALVAQTIANEALADIKANNLQVDGYQDLESTAYDVEQKAQAQALHDYQVANANGHAAATANS